MSKVYRSIGYSNTSVKKLCEKLYRYHIEGYGAEVDFKGRITERSIKIKTPENKIRTFRDLEIYFRNQRLEFGNKGQLNNLRSLEILLITRFLNKGEHNSDTFSEVDQDTIQELEKAGFICYSGLVFNDPSQGGCLDEQDFEFISDLREAYAKRMVNRKEIDDLIEKEWIPPDFWEN